MTAEQEPDRMRPSRRRFRSLGRLCIGIAAAFFSPFVAISTIPSARAEEPPAEAPGPVLTRAPELLGEALPAYPEELVEQGVQGEVVVRIVLDESGAVTSAELLSSLHPELDAAALRAARALRFSPAEVDGKPAAIAVDYTFAFIPPPPPPTPEELPPVRIEGVVADARTAAPIEGALVSVVGSEEEASTDAEGRFVLDGLLPGGRRIVVFHVDYERLVEVVEAGPGDVVLIESFLQPAAEDNETVVVFRPPWRVIDRAPLEPEPRPVMGKWELTRRDIELAPGVLGDAARAVQQLPGVAADSDLFATFHVRGGDQDETQFRLDGTQILLPNHLGGVFTMFNPKLVERVRLWASAPPASVGGGLAGALEVDYIDGDNDQVDGLIDLNLAMGAAHITGPIGPKGSLGTFVLSARRSYFELYFGILRATGLLAQQADFNLEFGEYFGKATLNTKGGRHRFRTWLMFAHNRLRLEADPDGEALLSLDNGLDTGSTTLLGAGDWLWHLGPAVDLHNSFSITRDQENKLQDAVFAVTRQITTLRPAWRSDLTIRAGEQHTIRAGLELAYLSLSGDGQIKDPRWIPTWAGLPWGDLGEDPLTFDANTAWTELALYAEDEWTGMFGTPLRGRFGLRVVPVGPTREVLFEPRIGLSLPLKTFTTFKANFGVVHQPPRDPVVYDPVVGAEDPKAERAFDFSVGVEQLLPWGALVRLEGYHRQMDRLLVNPDSRGAIARGGTYASIGSGRASGFDLFYGMRVGRFSMAATYSLLFASRTNPLNEQGPTTFSPFFDQRHGVKLGGQLTVGKKRNWVFSVMWELRSGKPRTPVTPRLAPGGEAWEVVPYAYDSVRRRPFSELNLRIEHHIVAKEAVKLTAYLDVLNLTYSQSDYVRIYGPGEVTDEGAVPPGWFEFKQLPIRPWFGIRGEF